MSDETVDPAMARLLGEPAVWADVPLGLRERTLAEALGVDPSEVPAVTDGISDDDGVVRPDFGADRPRHAAPGGPAGGRGRGWQRPALLAAAAVVVVGLAVGGGLAVRGGDDEPAGVEVALAGTEEAPGAVASARLRDQPAGVEVVLRIDGLPPAPAGTFYEAWLLGETGKVSAGTFHQRGDQDEIALWLGVDPSDYDAISVTRQPIEGGTLAEGVPVLRGELPPG